MKVASKCVADQMWYFPLLKPYHDHIPVKSGDECDDDDGDGDDYSDGSDDDGGGGQNEGSDDDGGGQNDGDDRENALL